MASDYILIEIKQAFEKPGCPICSFQSKIADRYIRFLLWENVNDPEIHEQMINSFGYCPEHTRQLALTEIDLFGGTMGVNIVYEHVAARVSQRLMNWRDKDLKGDLFWRIQNKLARWFNKPPVPKQVKLQTDTCFICQHQEKFAQYAMWSLFRELGRNNSGFKTQYSNSDGICLPHLQKGLSICSYSFPDGCEYIVDDTIRRLKCQRVHMMEYIRKHSWNYRHETYTSEEKMAWKHTLTCFSGYPPMEFDSNA